MMFGICALCANPFIVHKGENNSTSYVFVENSKIIWYNILENQMKQVCRSSLMSDN